MDLILGAGNTWTDYLTILGLYGALFILMRAASPRVELNFRKSYWVLFWGWAVGVFIGNYVFYKIGIMSFLPWANNFVHTFIWIGLALGFLYAGVHRKPFLEQFALFAIYSLIVKAFEHDILGTWELEHFFGIPGNTAYIVGWSLMDGLYPAISAMGLRVIGRFTEGIVRH